MTRTIRSAASALALLLAPILALPACAQEPAGQPAARAADRAAGGAAVDADPALWVVKDEDTTVYLFGTVHVLKPGMTWFDEAVRTAFDASGELVLEIVDVPPAEMQALIARVGVNPTGSTLTSRLPPAEGRALAAAAANDGLPMAALDRMDPWLAGLNLTMATLIRLGYDPANGPEKALADAAAAAGKPVRGLETAEQQFGIFDAMSPPAQARFLSDTLRDLPQVGTELERMIALWSRGDPDALAALLNDNLKETPEVARVLLFERNKRWADWIKARMDRPGTVFLAVGAGHLAGKGDVQDELAARGIRAVRVRY